MNHETPPVGRCPDCGLPTFPSIFGHVAGCPRPPRKVRITQRPLELKGRLFVAVTCPDGYRQGFYKSTGRNSGMAGQWLPCDGFKMFPQRWVDKTRFCHYALDPKCEVPAELDRFGTDRNKKLSATIKARERIMKPAKPGTPQAINKLIGTAWALRNHHENAGIISALEKLGIRKPRRKASVRP